MEYLEELVESCDLKKRRILRQFDDKYVRELRKRLRALEEKPIVMEYIVVVKKINDLLNDKNIDNLEEIKKLKERIEFLGKNNSVKDYKIFNMELFIISDYIRKYYISLNVILRKELLNYPLPEIYVYQGMLENSDVELYRHIVEPNTIKTGLDKEDIVIHPKSDIKSRRGYRKFYNRVSFRYLENMSKDYSYDIDNKGLTKVKMMRNN